MGTAELYGGTFVVYLSNERCGQLDRSGLVVDVVVRRSAAVAMAVAAGTVCLLCPSVLFIFCQPAP